MPLADKILEALNATVHAADLELRHHGGSKANVKILESLNNFVSSNEFIKLLLAKGIEHPEQINSLFSVHIGSVKIDEETAKLLNDLLLKFSDDELNRFIRQHNIPQEYIAISEFSDSIEQSARIAGDLENVEAMLIMDIRSGQNKDILKMLQSLDKNFEDYLMQRDGTILINAFEQSVSAYKEACDRLLVEKYSQGYNPAKIDIQKYARLKIYKAMFNLIKTHPHLKDRFDSLLTAHFGTTDLDRINLTPEMINKLLTSKLADFQSIAKTPSSPETMLLSGIAYEAFRNRQPLQPVPPARIDVSGPSTRQRVATPSPSGVLSPTIPTPSPSPALSSPDSASIPNVAINKHSVMPKPAPLVAPPGAPAPQSQQEPTITLEIGVNCEKLKKILESGNLNMENLKEVNELLGTLENKIPRTLEQEICKLLNGNKKALLGKNTRFLDCNSIHHWKIELSSRILALRVKQAASKAHDQTTAATRSVAQQPSLTPPFSAVRPAPKTLTQPAPLTPPSKGEL